MSKKNSRLKSDNDEKFYGNLKPAIFHNKILIKNNNSKFLFQLKFIIFADYNLKCCKL